MISECQRKRLRSIQPADGAVYVCPALRPGNKNENPLSEEAVIGKRPLLYWNADTQGYITDFLMMYLPLQNKVLPAQKTVSALLSGNPWRFFDDGRRTKNQTSADTVKFFPEIRQQILSAAFYTIWECSVRR